MFSALDKVETPDAKTVVFRLKTPDATFPMKIASGAGSIVDHAEYPADRLRTDGKAVGSGVYTLKDYGSQQAVFAVNGSYKGPAKVKNSGMTVKFFDARRQAQEGRPERRRRCRLPRTGHEGHRRPGQRLPRRSSTAPRSIEGGSAEVMHLVFNLKDPVAGKLGRPQGDRLPPGPLHPRPGRLPAHRGAALLDRPGRHHRPQHLLLRHLRRPPASPTRRRPRCAPPASTARCRSRCGPPPTATAPAPSPPSRKSPNSSTPAACSTPRCAALPTKEYEQGVADGKFGVYVKGWIPDYPDPDNFTAPFFGKDSVLANNYSSPQHHRPAAAQDGRPARPRRHQGRRSGSCRTSSPRTCR